MKNVLKITLSMFLLIVVFGLTLTANAQEEPAEEEIEEEVIVEPEQPEQPVEDPVVEEVNIRDMIKEFLDEWLIVILATMGGFAGTIGASTIKKKVVEKATDALTKSANANADGSSQLKEATNSLSKGLDIINAKIDEFESRCMNVIKEYEEKHETDIHETMKTIIKCISEIDFLKTEDSKFKELVALLVTSNPQLASNGYATKILELLNEGSEFND